MPEPLLPELTTDATVSSFSTAGKWETRTGQNLDHLRKSLKVTPARIQINSIPDVWARPLLFEMALFDSSHALHGVVLGEWRGLLAMIALRSVKGINALSVKPIRVSSNPNPAQNTQFLDAAAAMLPRQTINAETSFENSYIFLVHDGFRDRPIGMTSPTTLVFTSTHYFNYISSIQWFDGERLGDPTPHLSALEKPALASWLNHLRSRLHSLGNSAEGTILNNLTGLLDGFTRDLGVPLTPFTPAPQGFNISPAHGVFEFLDRPAAQPAAPASPVKLIRSAGRSDGPEIMIVDRDLPLQWGIAANQVHVGNKTLSDTEPTGHPDGVHTSFAGAPLVGVEAWNATEFFTDRLAVFRVPNAFPGTKSERWLDSGSPSDLSLLLPVKERLLDYLSPDDLISRMAFARGSSGEINVTLRLSLGEDAARRDFVVTKEYLSSDFDYLDEVPTIELFPNFKVPNWTTYYLAYAASNKNYAFQVKPVTPKPATNYNVPGEGPNALRNIWLLEEYPEALVCSVEDKNVGILLLVDPLRPVSQPNTYDVGVDFGASGTSVFYGSNGADVAPVTFNNHKLTVTNLNDLQKARIPDLFLPSEALDVPFLSLFKQFLNEANLQEIKPIVDGHIHYYNADSESDLNKPDIYADLKWSSDPQSRLRVKALLTQICYQTAVELASQGAGSINWKFSFPTAFSLTQQSQFSAIWGQIVESCSKLTGMRFDQPQSLTESIASAQYFRSKQRASTAVSAVFVDIGSSTSDVSVWQHDQLLWQTSLRLAGRDIFHRYLMMHPDVMEKFGVNTERLTLNAAGNEAKLWAETDALLQKHSEQMFRQLPVLGTGVEISKLRRHLALGLSGLAYYIGLGINTLIAANVFTEQMPKIYVGGNGSRMFRWLSDGDTAISPPANVLFGSVFGRALGSTVPGTFHLELSGAPKQEAAYGLVSTNALQAGDHSMAVIAGEKFVRDGVDHDWDTVIDAGFFDAPIMPAKHLDRLSDFISVFNQFAEQNPEFSAPVPWDTASIEGVRSQVAAELNDIARKGVVDVEPVFIIALRNLLIRNSEQ